MNGQKKRGSLEGKINLDRPGAPVIKGCENG
jgi:hypothetical protein